MGSLQAFVSVIESPSAIDLLDGRTEGRTLCEALRLSGVPHWYSLATTKETFLTALDTRLQEAWRHFKVPPILHFSMHGNEQGIGLTNGEFIYWDDLGESLEPLNQWMNGGLLICMSACFGVSGRRMAMTTDPKHTFWALVGNTGSPSWPEAAVAYVTFYHNFFKQVEIGECVRRMREATGDSGYTVTQGVDTKQKWEDYIARKAGAQSGPIAPPSPTPLPSA